MNIRKSEKNCFVKVLFLFSNQKKTVSKNKLYGDRIKMGRKTLLKSYHFILPVIFTLFSCFIFAQNASEELWNDVQEVTIQTAGERYIIPKSYRTLELDFQAMQSALSEAPSEKTVKAINSTTIIALPLPNGEFTRFKFVESLVMEDELANKYPGIKTYLGQGTDDATASARFDITPAGFHAIIFSVNGTVYIDPYSMGDNQHYISYYKKDFVPSEDQLSASCEVL